MGKYRRLTAFLEQLEQTRVTLSMAEMEQVLDFGLPASAYCHRSWWGNHRQAHREAWLDAGFKVDEVVMGSHVTFSETREDRGERTDTSAPGSYSMLGRRRCWVHFRSEHAETREPLVIVQMLDGDMEILAVPETLFRAAGNGKAIQND